MTIILDGKALSKKIFKELKREVEELKGKGIIPKISLILVGEDPASASYVNMKAKRAKRLGMDSEIHKLPENISERDLAKFIEKLNEDANVHGIVVQMPLPKHICERRISDTVDPRKDIDGLHSENLGRLLANEKCLVSPAAEGIMTLFKEYSIKVEGKHAVILGATELTGKPLAALLLNGGAAVTICHSTIEDFKRYTLDADIVVADIAKPKAIRGDMVKEGVVVVDCGFNYVEGKLVGDVNFDEVSSKAYAITPVPGGVGPMIIAILMRNLVKAVKLYHLK
ncbi:MAG: bifunctional 5,10-methylenetetrahydrofolate dehydrogenase/5,10-methenyltetrahydrofolate cyclohydrolase [archaeon GB-1867-097]|nr:bifunctional 5,10-methylenetetrahydrofolate dehydrogenase/5,10-methenyltetrahydrofolate cyclohydrolase [Candidatus Culexmicrobium thermophilum]MCS7384212.1 bifunctional 5,10-methylenetetrahydrofolate dehydrogenase/5,10-methenyltetrahydrofolate cyclohydrolase [Candidatus Culexmicrobium thermophilum]